jgi:hypothetical protein
MTTQASPQPPTYSVTISGSPTVRWVVGSNHVDLDPGDCPPGVSENEVIARAFAGLARIIEGMVSDLAEKDRILVAAGISVSTVIRDEHNLPTHRITRQWGQLTDGAAALRLGVAR